jgi:hypothetical protein
MRIPQACTYYKGRKNTYLPSTLRNKEEDID